MKNRQAGLATVEFAIIGAALLIVTFGVIEVGRAMFVWNSLTEGTRRAARLAAVCPVNHPAIARAARLASDEERPVLPNMGAANVTVEYLNAAGGATSVIDDMRFVRVQISGYQHLLLVPFFFQSITVPPFQTTLPVESLGYIPDTATWACPGA